MISRFFSESGSPKNAIDYLLDPEKQPELMRGNPQTFEALANALPFKNKYTSGVLRFNEKPDQPTLDSIMDEYSRFLTAGLNQPPEVLWVMHQEHGETELHFVLPNVDLESQRLFQPYLHKRDLSCRDALDNTINAKYGFTDPDDPANKRLVNSASNYLKLSKDRKELAQTIDDFVLNQAKEALKNGFKYTSANAINDIKNLGFGVKTSRGKLSITHEDMKKPMRLKGDFYEPNFSFSASRIQAIKSDSDRYRASSRERYEANASEYSRLFEQRASAVTKKYRASWKRVAERNQEHEQTQQADNKNNAITSTSNNSVVASAGVSANDFDQKQKHGTLQPTDESERTKQNEQDQDYGWIHLHEQQRLQLPRPEQQNDSLQASIIPCFYLNNEIGRIIDTGNKLTAQAFKSDKSAAFNIVIEGKKKGWKSIEFTGNDDFLKHAFTYALQQGLEVKAKNEHQQQLLKQVQENDRARKVATRAIKEIGERTGNYQERKRTIAEKSEDFKRQIKRFDKAYGAVKMKRENELDTFKTDINMVEYAKTLGFEVDRKASTAKSIKMKNGSDTLIISTASDGHGIYFNATSDRSGSIIDLCQEFKGLNLGQVRKELRPWIGRAADARTEKEHYTPKPKASSKNEQLVLNEWAKTEPLLQHPYLTSRGISQNVQSSPKFANRFRIDARKNVIFPHFKGGEVVGFEKKNNGFTGFSSGGEKALWYSNDLMKSEKIVIVESAIDAMSFEQLHGAKHNYGYISIGGQPNAQQLAMLERLDKSKIVIATDNDQGGEQIRQQIDPAGQCERITPESKDWNDDLKEQIKQQQQSRSMSM